MKEQNKKKYKFPAMIRKNQKEITKVTTLTEHDLITRFVPHQRDKKSEAIETYKHVKTIHQ